MPVHIPQANPIPAPTTTKDNNGAGDAASLNEIKLTDHSESRVQSEKNRPIEPIIAVEQAKGQGSDVAKKPSSNSNDAQIEDLEKIAKDKTVEPPQPLPQVQLNEVDEEFSGDEEEDDEEAGSDVDFNILSALDLGSQVDGPKKGKKVKKRKSKSKTRKKRKKSSSRAEPQ